ncbi:5563_t:CDS:2 [Acaulospora morrowiae]|uniref:3-hydroxyacyl-CoA dehydrogenase n=1 Tax=Acaulospora morrowiae TaxID=94023 RepID=A0A9N9BGU5_9GLOM|nr:5563_t:CDS:2 [Acaulospora morrowiae]
MFQFVLSAFRTSTRILPKSFHGHKLNSRAFSTSSFAQDIQKITVYGSGLMGAGIVQVAAQKGYAVTMVDLDEGSLERGKGIISSSLKRVAKKQFKDDEQKQKEFIEFTFSNIKTNTDSGEGAKDADLIIEAIVENIETKQKLFGFLDKIAPKDAIFASNTSSLPITELAKATDRADRFAGLHFFNPVPQMKLVEVVKSEKTSDETHHALMEFSKKLDKTPVTCKDTPGFIVNRLLVPYLLEAIRLVERGVATSADVDTAMKLGAGMPMGPFELSDFVGLDTLKSIADGWREGGQVDPNLVAKIKTLDDLVSAGNLGRKTGQGFFPY